MARKFGEGKFGQGKFGGASLVTDTVLYGPMLVTITEQVMTATVEE